MCAQAIEADVAGAEADPWRLEQKGFTPPARSLSYPNGVRIDSQLMPAELYAGRTILSFQSRFGDSEWLPSPTSESVAALTSAQTETQSLIVPLAGRSGW